MNSPAVSVALATTSPVLDLSGSTPFAIIVQCILHAKQPITIYSSDTILDYTFALHDHGLEFCEKDPSTGKIVASIPRPTINICPDQGRPAPLMVNKDRFITLFPEQPFVVEHAISKGGEDKISTGSESFSSNDLRLHILANGLQSDKTYIIRTRLGHAITWWRYGSAEAILKPLPSRLSSLTEAGWHQATLAMEWARDTQFGTTWASSSKKCCEERASNSNAEDDFKINLAAATPIFPVDQRIPLSYRSDGNTPEVEFRCEGTLPLWPS
ncbi:hypothetical protein L228DRAFT_250583 [Xylona heveae TC161]|uniref:Uncharacterized protein n=1 Tax=Xylona heveae (strain CBS 132557 / TC161) TaxID=1328760 RepID=A0A164ZUR0_XYLHT|nr:hypothetical protein L228DRAFT_250583 [Xylona heveae TC161]KZF19554.1 hypothetical protein L228DRAFT_250583 [Xylona heveae TC161]